MSIHLSDKEVIKLHKHLTKALYTALPIEDWCNPEEEKLWNLIEQAQHQISAVLDARGLQETLPAPFGV